MASRCSVLLDIAHTTIRAHKDAITTLQIIIDDLLALVDKHTLLSEISTETHQQLIECGFIEPDIELGDSAE